VSEYLGIGIIVAAGALLWAAVAAHAAWLRRPAVPRAVVLAPYRTAAAVGARAASGRLARARLAFVRATRAVRLAASICVAGALLLAPPTLAVAAGLTALSRVLARWAL
jgi:hypothetical protein